MFNDLYGLTEAVLDGRKTMTRRVVSDTLIDRYSVYDDYCSSAGTGGLPIERYYEKEFFAGQAPLMVGDVVAIAQSYKTIRDEYLDNKNFAKADTLEMETKHSNGWNNKMFVRADNMPHHIKITDIKVERLQNIPEEECLREGIRPCNFGKKFTPGDTRAYNTAREAFAALIDKVGKKGTWASNPWVFCYSFELID